MATNDKVPYHYEGPVVSPPDTPQPEPRAACGNCCGGGRCGAAVFMFGALAIMFALIFAAHYSNRHGRKSHLEAKQLGDLASQLRQVADDPRADKILAASDKKGRECYAMLIKRELLPSEAFSKLVSLNSNDTKASTTRQGTPDLLPANCSYTGPAASELPELLKRTGDDRCVLATFNSRNWNNYPDDGVLVLWSDGHGGEWLTFDDAHDDYGITAEEWADPAGKLFGKKAPFEHTYE